MAARDAYHSKALAEMTPMTSSLLTSNVRMSPICRISLNIQNGGTWRMSFESPLRAESDDIITFLFFFCISLNIQNGGSWRISFESPRRDDSDDVITFPSHLRMQPIFRISLNIQNDGTWRISFESPCRAESDDVNTSCIEFRDVTDYSYLIKYSKWRHVTHIIRKPLPRWVRWRHHFPSPTSRSGRFSVSHEIFKMAARDANHSKALAKLSPITSSLSESNLRMSPIFRIWSNIQNGGTWRISFESPRRHESDDVITFRIEPPDVADFLYLIKYSKWRHATHIIRKAWPRWVRSRHHFLHRNSGCRRFFVSH